MSDGTPEQRLLFTALRLDEAAEASLHSLLRGGFDITALEGLAAEHNVIALLYRRLKQVPAALFPAGSMQRLHDLYFVSALRSHRMTGLLLQTLDLLRESGIQALPFKGPALAVQAYGDLSLRQYDDLDLLIHESDVPRAYSLLVANGYQPPFQISPGQMGWVVRGEYDLPFSRSATLFELHWAMIERSNGYPLKAEALWENLDEIALLDRPTAVLSPESTAFFLCLHGAKHQWMRLQWIADLANLLMRHPAFDWDALFRLARIFHFERMVNVGLSLAWQVMGLKLPAEAHLRLSLDPQAERLSAQVQQRTLVERQNLETGDDIRFYLQARERLRDRLYYVFDQAFVPKQADWLNSPLPPGLYGVYYLARPFRVAVKLRRGRV